MVKVGDIVDGRRVTKVFNLCGMEAYQSEPVKEDNSKSFPEKLPGLGEKRMIIAPEEPEEKPKRGRKKREV